MKIIGIHAVALNHQLAKAIMSSLILVNINILDIGIKRQKLSCVFSQCLPWDPLASFYDVVYFVEI